MRTSGFVWRTCSFVIANQRGMDNQVRCWYVNIHVRLTLVARGTRDTGGIDLRPSLTWQVARCLLWQMWERSATWRKCPSFLISVRLPALNFFTKTLPSNVNVSASLPARLSWRALNASSLVALVRSSFIYTLRNSCFSFNFFLALKSLSRVLYPINLTRIGRWYPARGFPTLWDREISKGWISTPSALASDMTNLSVSSFGSSGQAGFVILSAFLRVYCCSSARSSETRLYAL